MPRPFVRHTLFAVVLLALPAAVHADPIVVLRSASGIAELAHVEEGGVSERQSVPFVASDFCISRTLTPSAGDTSAMVTAFLSSNLSLRNPAHMVGSGGAAAYMNTTEGTADVSAASQFFVEFQLTTPHAYDLQADFTASGDLSRDPFITDRGRWDISLVRGTSVMFASQGYSRELMERSGVLNPGCTDSSSSRARSARTPSAPPPFGRPRASGSRWTSPSSRHPHRSPSPRPCCCSAPASWARWPPLAAAAGDGYAQSGRARCSRSNERGGAMMSRSLRRFTWASSPSTSTISMPSATFVRRCSVAPVSRYSRRRAAGKP